MESTLKDLYDHRMEPFFSKEKFADFKLRMKRAKEKGDTEPNRPLKPMLAEHLVHGGRVVSFAETLKRLRLVFVSYKTGKGSNSFSIEAAK